MSYEKLYSKVHLRCYLAQTTGSFPVHLASSVVQLSFASECSYFYAVLYAAVVRRNAREPVGRDNLFGFFFWARKRESFHQSADEVCHCIENLLTKTWKIPLLYDTHLCEMNSCRKWNEIAKTMSIYKIMCKATLQSCNNF